jgi:hypothetical protein
MEQTVVFDEKVYLTPIDMNHVGTKSVEDILLNHLQKKLENRCSQHGFVLPNSLTLLSRSYGYLENGRFTGNVIYHVQAQGKVLNPACGTRVVGTVLKKNKMGCYVIYEDAIRILIPRDMHLGDDVFESLESGDQIEIDIRKSRFQIHDQFILSVGKFIKRTDGVGQGPEPTVDAQPVPSPNSPENQMTSILGNLQPVQAPEEEQTEEEETDQEESDESITVEPTLIPA